MQTTILSTLHSSLELLQKLFKAVLQEVTDLLSISPDDASDCDWSDFDVVSLCHESF